MRQLRLTARLPRAWSLAVSVTRQAGARRSQETARAWERLAPAWRSQALRQSQVRLNSVKDVLITNTDWPAPTLCPLI